MYQTLMFNSIITMYTIFCSVLLFTDVWLWWALFCILYMKQIEYNAGWSKCCVKCWENCNVLEFSEGQLVSIAGLILKPKILHMIFKIGKRASKSETETFGIVARFHRFEDWAPTSVQRLNVCTFPYSTYRKNLHLG